MAFINVFPRQMGEHYFFSDLRLITRDSLQEKRLLKAAAINSGFLGYPFFFCYLGSKLLGKALPSQISANFTFENYKICVTIFPGSTEFRFMIRTTDFLFFFIGFSNFSSEIHPLVLQAREGFNFTPFEFLKYCRDGC